MRDITGQSNLDLVYDEYHWIARYYHWDRSSIRELSITERKLWVRKIVDHEKFLRGIEDPLASLGGE